MNEIQLQTMSARHFKIVDLCVKGFTNKQIASELNMSQCAVSIIVNSPTFKHEFALRRAQRDELTDKEQIAGENEAMVILKEGAVNAAKRLVEHVDSVDETISVRSCAEVLDRTGSCKIIAKPQNTVNSVIIINEEGAKLLVETMNMESDGRE